MSKRDSARVLPVRNMPLAEQAREGIRASILDGSFKPGERITIEGLAAELGISRTPVREALKALEQDGLVHLLPHRGAVVEAMAREEVYHRYTIRAMLEGYAAELACKADSARIAEELEAVAGELEMLSDQTQTQRDDPEAVRRLSDKNREFHSIIRDGCGSRTLIRVLLSLRNPAAYTYSHWADPERRRFSLEIHKELVEAFRRGDSWMARRLMERHILEARDAVMAGHPDEELDTGLMVEPDETAPNR